MKERELFLAALEIEDPAARQAHLKTECADDAELLARVKLLLSSHEGQSQFLNTPVVEQIADASGAGSAATLFFENSSTRDEDPDATTFYSQGSAPMTEHQDNLVDEIPLGYLQPSSKPGSLGRLGHYEIHEVLGRGGFGTVLKAFDEKLHRVVAIKVLAPEMAATSPARKRFLREAQASAAIRHEHVVSVYAVEESPIPYLVMEYIPGLTLQQRLDEKGPLDVPTVLRLGRQIAEGLAGAHAQELIHRDIKPGNILLETSVYDRVKITDFGLARAADDASLTQSGTIAGTPMYMAPEQALGHKLDQRADLFSFGSVLYQMVSGRAPFRAPTMMAVLKRVTEDIPRPIREIIPETPQWLCDIITKLHAKNPDERYQSAREIADVLADCESQLKAHSGLKDFSLIPRAKTQPWYQNLKVAIGGGATAVLLLLAAIFWFQTPNGTLRVEILDPEVEMKVKGTELTFHGTNLDPVSLKTGDKKLLITRGDLVFETESFTLKKGTETRVKIELLGGNLVVSDGGKVIAEQPITRKGIANSTTGNDTVASARQTSNPDTPPPAIAPFDAKQARAHQEAWAKHLGVPVEYTNSIGMKFRLIPPGEFTMGSTAAEITSALKEVDPFGKPWPECIQSEAPRHQVILTRPIYLGVNEVTQAEYEKVTGTNPSHFAPLGMGKMEVAGMKTTDHPVEMVSWNDAAEFCSKLSNQEKLKPFYFRSGETVTPLDGTGYRLPSEAEWEFACRAGTTTKYWTGDKNDDLARAGWFGENAGGRTHPAGELKTNPFGLVDIHGNVWEWIEDGWNPTWYGRFQEKPAIDPQSPFSGNVMHILRGGDWFSHYGTCCRSPVRFFSHHSHRGNSIGFRVSLPVDAVQAANAVTIVSAAVQALREMVAAKESERDQAKQSFRDGQLSKLELIYAELDATEARIQLTQAEQNAVANLAAFRRLVAFREQERELVVQQLKAGVVKEDVLERSDSGLTDARGRLSKAIADAPSTAFFTDADAKRISALPAAEQVVEVRKELKRLNLQFDGTLTPTIENDVVTGLSFNSDEIDNIAPVRALSGLTSLDCRGTYPNKGKLSDLSPLKGMTINRLDCSSTQIADLTPLASMSLTILQFNHNPVSDLTPLKGMPLLNLGCAETKVSDLSPLKGMKLQTLGAQLLPVTDLSPLQGMPLTGLDLYHTIGVTNLEPLKGMPLEGLNLQDVPVSDLSPLKGMTTLRTLLLQGNKVTDLSPLAGLKLTDLLLHDKQITDLSPLKGLPLTRLMIDGTGVSDLSPLQGMSLAETSLTPKNITQGMEILREMKSLKTIGTGLANQVWPAAEFWDHYDKGEFTK